MKQTEMPGKKKHAMKWWKIKQIKEKDGNWQINKIQGMIGDEANGSGMPFHVFKQR